MGFLIKEGDQFIHPCVLLLSSKDIQAFLRIASTWSSQGAAFSHTDTDTTSVAARPDGEPAKLSESAAARKQALDRLKHRLKGSRVTTVPSLKGQPASTSHQGSLAPPFSRPLLQPYAPQAPQFMDLRPQLPTSHALPPSSAQAPQQAKGASSAALEALVRQAEALKKSLAEVSTDIAPVMPSAGPGGGGGTRASSAGPPSRLSLLQFINDPEITHDLVRESLVSQTQDPRGGGSSQGWRGGPAGQPRGDDLGSVGYSSSDGSYDSDGSYGEEDGGDGVRRGRGRQAFIPGEGDEDEEDEEDAAAWSEQQLLGQLFFPTSGQDKEVDDDGRSGGNKGKASSDAHPSMSPEKKAQLGSQSDEIGSNSAVLSSPQLHIEVLDLGVLPSRHSDLSIVIKSPSLSSSTSQGQHWSLGGGAPAADGDASPPLARVSLPAHTDVRLPCPLVLEVWDQRSILVGVVQLALTSPALDPASLKASFSGERSASTVFAHCSGSSSLRNPLLSEEEEEALLADCLISVAARIEVPLQASDLNAEAQGDDHPGGILAPERGHDLGEEGAQDEPPMLRHTFRVTVCGASGLPGEVLLSDQGKLVPKARFLRYIYPG